MEVLYYQFHSCTLWVNVLKIKLIRYDSSDENYCREEKTFKGDACMPRMINNICEYYPRTKMILDLVKKYYTESRKILILSDRREQYLYFRYRLYFVEFYRF